MGSTPPPASMNCENLYNNFRSYLLLRYSAYEHMLEPAITLPIAIVIAILWFPLIGGLLFSQRSISYSAILASFFILLTTASVGFLIYSISLRKRFLSLLLKNEWVTLKKFVERHKYLKDVHAAYTMLEYLKDGNLRGAYEFSSSISFLYHFSPAKRTIIEASELEQFLRKLYECAKSQS